MLHCPVCSSYEVQCRLALNAPCRRDTFTLDMLQIPQGAGSGFVWDDAGHVVCLAACCLKPGLQKYKITLGKHCTALHCKQPM